MQIALDGPAGAGKTSIAKKIAQELNILYLDTGAMYRAVGYKAMQMGIDTLDEQKVSEMAESLHLDVTYKNNKQHIMLDGKDVTKYIREPDVSINASNASKHKRVREKLVELQRQIAQKEDVVVDGRDIGTYVLPGAEYKFYITADCEERAKRKKKQYADAGIYKDMNLLKQEIEARDYQDMNRDFAPLKIADDAVIVDTTNMSFSEAVDFVMKEIKVKG